MLLGILLEVDDYISDPNDRQALATVAYYIITKGLFKEIYDGDRTGIANPLLSYELSELLGTRLSIMNDSPQSLKYSLNASSTLPIDKNWSPYSTANIEDKVFENMKVYDAYLIDDRSRGSMGMYINPECIKMSKQILETYEPSFLNGMVIQGYNNH